MNLETMSYEQENTKNNGVNSEKRRKLVKVEILFEDTLEVEESEDLELSISNTRVEEIIRSKLTKGEYILKTREGINNGSVQFDNIPDIFKSLLLRGNVEDDEYYSHQKTASGKRLPIEGERKFEEIIRDDHFLLSKKIENLIIRDKGHLLDVLICDKFKENYESSLTKSMNHSQEGNSCEHINKSKGYQISVLFGNISYAIGLYEKAIQFYERAVNLLNDQTPEAEINDKTKTNSSDSLFEGGLNSDSDSENTTNNNNKVSPLQEPEYIHLIHFALLENNIAKSLINNFHIQEGIIKLKKANKNLEKAGKLMTNIGNEEHDQIVFLKTNILFNLSEAYYIIEDYDRAKRYLDQSYSIFNSHLLYSLHMLPRYLELSGKINMKNNNYSEAIHNFDECLKLLKEEDHLECITGVITVKNREEHLMKISEIYNDLAIVHTQLKEPEMAINFAEKSLAIRRRVYGEDSIKTLMSYTNLGYLYQSIKKNKNALETLQLALNKSEDNKEVEGIFNAVIYRALGQCYFALGNEIKGLNNYSKANTIYKKYYQEKIASMSEMNMIIKNMYGLITV